MASQSHDHDSIDEDENGPIFVISASGRKAMQFTGDEVGVEDLIDWAEANQWTAEPIDDGSVDFKSVLLSNPATGASLTVPWDCYVVFDKGEYFVESPEEYEMDPWSSDENSPVR